MNKSEFLDIKKKLEEKIQNLNIKITAYWWSCFFLFISVFSGNIVMIIVVIGGIALFSSWAVKNIKLLEFAKFELSRITHIIDQSGISDENNLIQELME